MQYVGITLHRLTEILIYLKSATSSSASPVELTSRCSGVLNQVVALIGTSRQDDLQHHRLVDSTSFISVGLSTDSPDFTRHQTLVCVPSMGGQLSCRSHAQTLISHLHLKPCTAVPAASGHADLGASTCNMVQDKAVSMATHADHRERCEPYRAPSVLDTVMVYLERQAAARFTLPVKLRCFDNMHVEILRYVDCQDVGLARP